LLAVTFTVGVAPLVSYGYPGIIGENWDIENYLPVARYLERGPVSAIAEAPPNPLRDLNASPPSIGLTLGFSIFHGSVDLLTGQEAVTTFAVLLAWLRSLGVAGIYVLFRAALGLRREWALLGAAISSAGGLLLWVGYFSFGMQLAAWPLLALGLVLGVASIQFASKRGRDALPSLLGAAIAIAALPIAYYPALTLFLPLALGLGLAVLAGREVAELPNEGESNDGQNATILTRWLGNSRLKMLAGGGALFVGIMLISVPAIYDYTQGFSFRYGQQLTSLGLFRYVPLTDFAGLTTFDLRTGTIVPMLAWVGLGGLLIMMLAGLAWGPKRTLWLGMAAGAALYLVWLRLEDYPYAWMKGGAYAAFPFLGLAAAGAQGIFNRPWPSALRASGSVVAVALLLLMAISQWQTVSAHMDEPGLFAEELPEMLSLRNQIPPGRTVRLTSDPRIRGVRSALPAYLLDHATVIGTAGTGYVPHWENGEPDEVGEYGLFTENEDPEDWGFSRDAEIWRAGGYSLYENNGAVLLQARPNTTVRPGEPYLWPFRGPRPEGSSPTPSYRLGLDIAAFGETAIRYADKEIKVPAGLSRISLLTTDDVENGIFLNVGPNPVVVMRARTPDFVPLTFPEGSASVVASAPLIGGGAVAGVEIQALEADVTTTLAIIQPDIGPVTYALDIWDDGRGAHFGWYGFEQMPARQPVTITLKLDLTAGSMTAVDSDGAPVTLGGGVDRIAPGDYIARLNVLAGTSVLAAPVDLFSFSVDEDGSISNTFPEQPLIVAATLDRPTVPLEVAVGEDVQLLGYALDRQEVQPGEEVALTIWWRAEKSPLDERSVLIHVLDAAGRERDQADGPPAQGGRPTTRWQVGETTIDKHTFDIPSDLPEGNYVLTVGMYRFPSLELLPLHQGEEPVQGNVLHIPLRVER
jgi:hypothetical protein